MILLCRVQYMFKGDLKEEDYAEEIISGDLKLGELISSLNDRMEHKANGIEWIDLFVLGDDSFHARLVPMPEVIE